MFVSFRRIAAHGASLLLMGVLLIGLMIGAPRPRANAQEVSPSTLETYAQPPVPVAKKYVPWASEVGIGSGIKTFSIPPKTSGIILCVILGTIVLANVRIRPRRQSY